MPTSKPGSASREALRHLQQAGQALRQATEQFLTPPLTSLQQAIATLAASAALRRRHCPAAYVLDWHNYLLGQKQSLSPRAVRYLCWEPAVATHTRFQSYLDVSMETLSSHALQGLVWCCHTCWSPAFAASTVAQRVRQRLAAYHGDHALLRHWSQYAEVVLGPTGPARLAAALLAERAPITTLCSAWGLDERTPYMLEVLRQALPACWQALRDEAALGSYLITVLLPWAGWTTADFRMAVGTTVLHPVINSTPGLPAQLMQLALADARLGDPRLPAQLPNWRELPQEAYQRFVQWLSQADIALFFEHILPECKDQEERKTFWLRYVPCMLRTRPLLHEADVARLQPHLAQIPEQMLHCGTLHGSTSALLIDFGEVVVAQVSEISEACHVYGRRNFAQLVPDFWRAQPFTVAELLVSRQAATIQHQQTWEKDVAEILSLCDIRPTYKEDA